MAILVDADTNVICQGFTGSQGTFHSEQAIAYGTKMVGGVTPGKGGTSTSACRCSTPCTRRAPATGADASVIYVPPAFAADAILEAVDAGIELVVVHHRGHARSSTWCASSAPSTAPGRTLIGPNCPGVITPGECKIGIMPGHIHRPARSASCRAPAP